MNGHKTEKNKKEENKEKIKIIIKIKRNSLPRSGGC
jgi:hypothetical protein